LLPDAERLAGRTGKVKHPLDIAANTPIALGYRIERKAIFQIGERSLQDGVMGRRIFRSPFFAA
jgi:hypothetical protein